MLPTQHAHRTGTEGEQSAPHRRQPQPAGGEHPQDVPVGHAEGVSVGLPGPPDDPIGPAAHVGRPLPLRPRRRSTATTPDVRPGSGRWSAPRRRRSPTREGPARSLRRTPPGRTCPEPAATGWSGSGRTVRRQSSSTSPFGLFPPLLEQGNIRPARVLTTEGPFGRAVASRTMRGGIGRKVTRSRCGRATSGANSPME